MLSPIWFNPRIGPLIRGGIDIQYYRHQILLMGLFKRAPMDIQGANRIRIKLTATREPEPDSLSLPPKNSDDPQKLIVFSGDKNQFSDLYGWSDFLLRELRSVTKNGWLQLADKYNDIVIGINVRWGNDFKHATSKEDFFLKGGIKTPLRWFAESLKVIREVFGFPAKAVVVSDGTEKDLEQLLGLQNVMFLRPGCAISDLLVLTKTKVLIGSGGSSFSAWASFLGQMPTISHPGQSLSWFKLRSTDRCYVGEFDPAAPSKSFIESLKALRLSNTILD